MRMFTALFCALSLMAGTAFPDSIQTIQLQHRPADELMPIIRPMLGTSDSLTGQGYRLFIRTSEENFQHIQQMVDALDVKPRQLLISVFQGNDRELRALAVSEQIQYQDGYAQLDPGSRTQPERGANVHYSTRNASADAQTLSTRGRLSDSPIHQLRILEGNEGYIETGESFPYPSGCCWRSGHRGKGDYGIEYKDINTGFYVLPRVQGEQVTLDISPYKESRSEERASDIETQSASTRITGRLGQWLPLGGVTEQTGRSGYRSGSYGSTQSRGNASVWIRADLVQ